MVVQRWRRSLVRHRIKSEKAMKEADQRRLAVKTLHKAYSRDWRSKLAARTKVIQAWEEEVNDVDSGGRANESAFAMGNLVMVRITGVHCGRVRGRVCVSLDWDSCDPEITPQSVLTRLARACSAPESSVPHCRRRICFFVSASYVFCPRGSGMTVGYYLESLTSRILLACDRMRLVALWPI